MGWKRINCIGLEIRILVLFRRTVVFIFGYLLARDNIKLTTRLSVREVSGEVSVISSYSCFDTVYFGTTPNFSQ